MGLSSKQVSGDGLDWTQTLLQAQTLQLPKPPASRRQQQQSELLKCPRCESTNTKFCYYNNYNRSQPRHFCKTCKRHWTNGGTLRNVPVGGGRKSKRQKTSKATANTTAANANTTGNTTVAACTGINSKILNRVNPSMAFDQAHQHLKQSLPFVPCDQRSISGTHQALTTSSSALPQNSMSCSNLVNKNFSSYNHGMFSYSSNSSATQNHQGIQFPCTSSSSFETHPPIFQSLDAYHNNAGQVLENSTSTTIMPTSCSALTTQPWQVPSTSSGMDIQSYWNWEDFDTFIPTDLSIPWDDSEIKP